MIDLRQLMLMIKENKEMKANMSLEFDCLVEADNSDMLIRVINYIINYLTPLTEKDIEISLNAYRGGSMLSFAISTGLQELPEFSDKIAPALEPYNATCEVKHQQGVYAQVILTFS